VFKSYYQKESNFMKQQNIFACSFTHFDLLVPRRHHFLTVSIEITPSIIIIIILFFLKMTVLASALAVVAGGFLSRETATLARQLIEAKLGKPRLVRETSRANHGFAVSLVLMPWQIGVWWMHTRERETRDE
jgi:hypothetical protein